MWKQRVLGVVCLGLLVAVAWLWLRVRELETTVDEMARRPAAPAREALKSESPEPFRMPQSQINYRVIEAKFNSPEGTSRLLFPPEVERAMLGEGHQRTIDLAPLSQGSSPEVRLPFDPSDVPQEGGAPPAVWQLDQQPEK
jgi:hypothetical protein